MKKLFGIVAIAASILMTCVFTGCAQEYTGRYWVTEYVENISEADYNNNYKNKNKEEQTAWRKSWATTYSSTYVKKTGITTPELSTYMESLMNITDSEIKSDLEEIGPEPKYNGLYYIISAGEGNPYNILYVTEQK